MNDGRMNEMIYPPSDDFGIYGISVISGIRPCGRTVDYTVKERATCGFLYIWCGEACFYDLDGKKTVVVGGDLLYIPKHKKYQMKYTADSTTFVLVNFEMTDQDGRELAPTDEIAVLARDDERNRIAKIMTGFELCSASRTFDGTVRKKELLYRLFGLLSVSASMLSFDREIDLQILEGVRLLRQTYLENLPIHVYAEACHISVQVFRTVFHKQFGMSPVKYRNSLRIERASELLRDGSLTVAEVAYASGFENIGYFCRYYRKVTGEAPGDTKKRYTVEGFFDA